VGLVITRTTSSPHAPTRRGGTSAPLPVRAVPHLGGAALRAALLHAGPRDLRAHLLLAHRPRLGPFAVTDAQYEQPPAPARLPRLTIITTLFSAALLVERARRRARPRSGATGTSA
jgi:hypothetical protein